MAKFIKNSLGNLTEEATVGTSAGAADAGKVVNLNASGLIDTTMLSPAVGVETTDLVASEALAAGDIVNIWNDAGVAKARKADASDVSTQASGFVLSAYALNATAQVYLEGTNTALTGLTPGTSYFLSEVAGAITATAPATASAIVQRVGRSHGTTKLSFEASQPIILV